MSMNEAVARYHLINPVLRDKGCVSRDHITLETVLTPPPVGPSGSKGRRRKGRIACRLNVQLAELEAARHAVRQMMKKVESLPERLLAQTFGAAA